MWILQNMAKKFSLSSIIKPDESEYVEASKMDVGLADAYEPVISGSAMHGRPLPVTMYTFDEESEDFEDTPLARAPMRITRRYVPSTRDSRPMKVSTERPEFPLFNEQQQQKDTGIVYPEAAKKYTSFAELKKEDKKEFIAHDFESEMIDNYVGANPGIISLLQKQGKDIPVELSIAEKLQKANKNKINSNTNNQGISASERVKTSAKLFVPDSIKKSDVKKKITV